MIQSTPGADVRFIRASAHPGHGAVAQLGERRVRNAKVRGSIPLGSTNRIEGSGRSLDRVASLRLLGGRFG